MSYIKGVTSFNTLIGDTTISAGANITLTPSGQDIEIAASGGGGVTSLNTLTGDVTISAGSNITLTPVGNDIEIAASSTLVDCKARNVSAQSLTSGADTAIALDTEDFKNVLLHDNVAANTQIQVPTGQDGTYLLISEIDWEPASTGTRLLTIAVNGTGVAHSLIASAGASPQTNQSVTALVELVGGDYVEIYGTQTSGSPLTVVGVTGLSVIRLF